MKMINIINLIFIIVVFCQSNKNSFIDKNYVDKNFSSLSNKKNLLENFQKLLKNGGFYLLEYFTDKLNNAKIDFKNEYEKLIQNYRKGNENIYNILKYKDDYKITKISPAFEWIENEGNLIFFIKYSKDLNTIIGCPFVDDEKAYIRKNNRTFHYESKCIYEGNYLHFNLEIKLYEQVKRKLVSRINQRGQTKIIIEKVVREEWNGRITEPGTKLPENSMRYNIPFEY